MDITNEIRKIVAAVLRIDWRIIPMNASFSDELGADSLDMLEIITQIEDKYNITVPDSMTGCTFGDLVEFVKHETLKQETQKEAELPVGLFVINKNKPVCLLTNKRCRQISQEILNNQKPGQNLCTIANCCLANNFYKLSQKVK